MLLLAEITMDPDHIPNSYVIYSISCFEMKQVVIIALLLLSCMRKLNLRSPSFAPQSRSKQIIPMQHFEIVQTVTMTFKFQNTVKKWRKGKHWTNLKWTAMKRCAIFCILITSFWPSSCIGFVNLKAWKLTRQRSFCSSSSRLFASLKSNFVNCTTCKIS